MKIVVVVHDYLPLHLGGTEKHAHQLAVELVGRGHEVVALFTEYDTSVAEGTCKRGELDGVRTIEMAHHRRVDDVHDGWEQPASEEVFAKVLAEERPDVVHFQHVAHWGGACVEHARSTGAATLITLNDFYALCDNAVLLRPDGELCTAGPKGDCTECLEHYPVSGLGPKHPERPAKLAQAARDRHDHYRDALRHAQRAICPSQFLADVFVEAGVLTSDQVRVLRYGYPGPLAETRPARRGGPLKVGFLGGLYVSKGVHVLVEAFRHLEPDEAELVVHGALDWFPEYVAELRRLARGKPVTFAGISPPEKVDEALRAMDVLVVPSLWYENFPLTIQEAFRNAVPVVVTDLGGMAEAVTAGVDGLVFPRGDARALADRLRRLSRDRDLLERLAAGRTPPITVPEVADRVLEFYAECGAPAERDPAGRGSAGGDPADRGPARRGSAG